MLARGSLSNSACRSRTLHGRLQLLLLHLFHFSQSCMLQFEVTNLAAQTHCFPPSCQQLGSYFIAFSLHKEWCKLHRQQSMAAIETVRDRLCLMQRSQSAMLSKLPQPLTWTPLGSKHAHATLWFVSRMDAIFL